MESDSEFGGIAVLLRVGRPKPNFQNTLKNGIKSKRKSHFEGNSIKYERCFYYLTNKDFENEAHLKSMADIMPNKVENH